MSLERDLDWVMWRLVSVLSSFPSVFVLLAFKLEHKIYMCFSEAMPVLLRKRFVGCHKSCSSMQSILLKTFTQMCLNYLYHKYGTVSLKKKVRGKKTNTLID